MDETRPNAFIGMDNGVTGSIGIITSNDYVFMNVPTFKEQSYTKKKGQISRINSKKLIEILKPYADNYNCHVAFLERPMINPTRWRASMSAMRALEATLICYEILGIGIRYIDSKEWQRKLLPHGTKTDILLKKASVDIASRMFPNFREQYQKHGDGDSILIAEYCRQQNLNIL